MISSLRSLGVLFAAITVVQTNSQSNNILAPPELWISDLFYRALANFTVRNVGSTACQKQSEMYDRGLRNHTNWAVRIVWDTPIASEFREFKLVHWKFHRCLLEVAESWNRHPNGLLAGNTFHLGIYDECIDIYHPLKGRYCLSQIKLMPSEESHIRHNAIHNRGYNIGSNHAWQTLLGWIDYPDQFQRNILNLGICIPDSCTSSDLQKTLQNELDKVFSPEHVKAVVNVDPILCSVKEDMYPYNTAFYITSAIFVMCVFLCLVATLHQYITITCQQDKTKISNDDRSVFYSFSIIESSKDLFKYDENNELNIINGLKVIVMIFVLFGHRFMYVLGNPMTNVKLIENIFISGPDILLTCMNMVDPFFFISGFLVYITITPVFKKPGPILTKIITPIVYRITRILPAYCAVMAITVHIVPHLGDGPVWQKNIWNEAEKCKNYWWTNLLFISNYYDANDECLLISWYLSCDIQFFIVGIVIVYIYTKSAKCGKYVLGVLIGTSFFLPFIITFLKKSDGLLKVDLPFLENPRKSETYNTSYRPSYMRAFPFVVGLAMGFIVDKLKKKKFKFSQMTVYAGTILVFLICIYVQLLGAEFYKNERPYYPFEHALYATLSHCTWTIIAVWIAICHFTTGYGLLTYLLSNRFFVSLGRLSYSVLLVNITIMNMSQSSQRVPTYVSTKTILDLWICDLFKSYLMGFILYMVVEAPLGNLTKQLFGRGRKSISLNTESPVEQIISVEVSIKESSNL